MPELPEVETVRRGLEPVLAGALIEKAEVRRADLRFPFPPRFAARLSGARVLSLRRRAKFILAPLSSGETWLVHLGMTGRFVIHHPEASDMPGAFHHAAGRHAAHDHVQLRLAREGGRADVVYNDVRRFGFMDLVPDAEVESHPMLAGLGVEPLGNEFSGAFLLEALAGRRTPLKAALLDQTIVAGLGNIYVCEALNRARLSPLRHAGTISAREAGRLAAAIRAVLEEALAAGGSTLRDFVQADGSLGYFQHSFRAYDREGAACTNARCAGTILRLVQSGRSTFYCARCQT